MAAHDQPVEIFVPEVEAFGGAERAVLALARWFAANGIDHRILTYHDRLGLERYAQAPLDVLQLRPAPGGRAKVAALRKHFEGEKQQRRLLCSGYQPALHATLGGARGFHCMMHDTPSLFGDEGRRTWMHRLRLRASNALIGRGLRSGGTTVVNSEFLKSECRRDFGVEAVIARMGGMPSAGGFHERRFDGAIRMLSVCRIEPNKRIDWMLQALATLEVAEPPLSSRVDWRLMLAGKGSLIAPLQHMAQELRIGDRVDFLGFVSDEHLQQLMREAHLFLMPAIQGFGIPAIEALQAGIPVLLHRESGVSDILRQTPWATVFDGDAAAMVPALRDAIDRVIAGEHLGQELPQIWTEDEWSAEVARLCRLV